MEMLRFADDILVITKSEGVSRFQNSMVRIN